MPATTTAAVEQLTDLVSIIQTALQAGRSGTVDAVPATVPPIDKAKGHKDLPLPGAAL